MGYHSIEKAAVLMWDDPTGRDHARQLRNWIGSGKVRVELVNGQPLVPKEEVQRVRWLHWTYGEDAYCVWDVERGCLRWVNSYLGARLADYSQDYLCDRFARGELAGRKQGNATELEIAGLEKWSGKAITSGLWPPAAHPASISPPAGAGQQPLYRQP